MHYRFLGATGLRVSSLALGAMTFGQGSEFAKTVGAVDESRARELIALALDRGVNHFDTANVYGRGASETILGAALKGVRDSVVLSTKVHGRMSDGINDRGQSRSHLVGAVEASLRRLQTDYVDILYLHGVDEFVEIADVLETVGLLVASGKVRYCGVSNFAAWQLMRARDSGLNRLARPMVQQCHYSLLARDAENELLPLSRAENVGFVVWSPLSNGLLSGKYASGADAGDRRLDRMRDDAPIDESRLARVLDAARKVAEGHGATSAQVAISYLLNVPGVTSVLVGARTTAQLAELLDAERLRLTDADFDLLSDASDASPVYPRWHQERYSRRLKPRPSRRDPEGDVVLGE